MARETMETSTTAIVVTTLDSTAKDTVDTTTTSKDTIVINNICKESMHQSNSHTGEQVPSPSNPNNVGHTNRSGQPSINCVGKFLHLISAISLLLSQPRLGSLPTTGLSLHPRGRRPLGECSVVPEDRGKTNRLSLSRIYSHYLYIL
uniref:Uncharacterized protein n=1 Tax=Caenorhabditis japonica TaxID=281687 RepID=A0A8R1IGL7_CAEJA